MKPCDISVISILFHEDQSPFASPAPILTKHERGSCIDLAQRLCCHVHAVQGLSLPCTACTGWWGWLSDYFTSLGSPGNEWRFELASLTGFFCSGSGEAPQGWAVSCPFLPQQHLRARLGGEQAVKLT